MKHLLPITWAIWGASLAGLVYFLHRIAAASASGFYSLRDLLLYLLGAVILVELLAGAALYWAPARLSDFGVTAIAILCGIPLTLSLVFLAAEVISANATASTRTRLNSAVAEAAERRNPTLRPIAAAITAADPAALKQALALPANLTGKDGDGKGLIHYAVSRYLFNDGSLECIQLLLAAGADPNSPEPSTGFPPMVALGEHPAALGLFVDAGADIETNVGGLTPVVYFTMLRKWDGAIYLIEKGARLDTHDANGMSLDYFLNEWKDSVNDQHPEGWDRLRAAITSARRANRSAAARPNPPSPSAPPAARQR